MMQRLLLVIGIFLGVIISAPADVQAFAPRGNAAGASYHFMRGYAADLSHDWKVALEQYEKALSLDPSSIFLKRQVIYARYRNGDADGAVALLQTALSENPDSVEILELAGEIYKDLNKPQDAIGVYQKIITFDPDNAEAQFNLGVLAYFQDDRAMAKEILGRLVRNHPETIRAIDILAAIAIDEKEYDEAKAYLERILSVREDYDPAYLKLGVISEMQDNPAEAIQYYSKALEYNPHNRQVRERLTQIYLKQKSKEKAVEELRKMNLLAPEDAEVHLRLGLIFFEDKQYDKALEEFDLAKNLKPDQPMIRYYRSLVLEEMGKYDDAIAELKYIIGREPKNISAFLHLAYIYTQLKQEDEAIRIYDEILSFEKERPEVYVYYANGLIQMKDYQKAEAVLRDAIPRFPENDDLLFNLAVVCEKTGRFDDMVTHLQKAITLNPKNSEALNYLGYSFADRNVRLVEAEDLIRRALELRPDSPYYIDSLGWVYYRRGEYGKALEHIQKAIGIMGDDPVLFEHLGDIYQALNEPGKAIDAWGKALQYHKKEEGLEQRVQKKISDLKQKQPDLR